MTKDRFYELIEGDKALYGSEIYELKELIEKFPYFQQIIFIYLKATYQTKDSDHYQAELERLSPYVGDRKALYYFIFEKNYKDSLEKTFKKINLTDDLTSNLIEGFLNRYDSKDPITDKFEYEEQGISMATSDYFIFLGTDIETEKAEIISPMKYQKVIDDFIKAASEDEKQFKIDKERIKAGFNPNLMEEGEMASLEDNAFFTETLAKIYVKQKRYEKAHKIIKHLSLNFPEKNLYFADQLSFLEKLIQISKQKE